MPMYVSMFYSVPSVFRFYIGQNIVLEEAQVITCWIEC